MCETLGMDAPEHAPEETGFWEIARKAFLTGLLVCLPVTLTAYIIVWLIDLMASPARGILNAVLRFCNVELGTEVPFFDAGATLVSALIVAIFLVLIGLISRYVLGKWFISRMDDILQRLPMVRSVYVAIKQIIDTFSVGKKQTFSKVVLVEFPRRDAWTLAFITHEKATLLCELTRKNLVHVFVPTTPNPTGGYMICVPVESVFFLDISVAEAMKMVVSGGAVVPEKLLSRVSQSSN